MFALDSHKNGAAPADPFLSMTERVTSWLGVAPEKLYVFLVRGGRSRVLASFFCDGSPVRPAGFFGFTDRTPYRLGPLRLRVWCGAD